MCNASGITHQKLDVYYIIVVGRERRHRLDECLTNAVVNRTNVKWRTYLAGGRQSSVSSQFLARDSTRLARYYAIARPSVRPSH